MERTPLVKVKAHVLSVGTPGVRSPYDQSPPFAAVTPGIAGSLLQAAAVDGVSEVISA